MSVYSNNRHYWLLLCQQRTRCASWQPSMVRSWYAKIYCVATPRLA